MRGGRHLRPYPGGPSADTYLTASSRTISSRGFPTTPQVCASAGWPRTTRSGMAGETDRKLRWVRDAAGDRYGDLELNMVAFAVGVTEARAAIMGCVAPRFGVDAAEFEGFPHALFGTHNERPRIRPGQPLQTHISALPMPSSRSGQSGL